MKGNLFFHMGIYFSHEEVLYICMRESIFSHKEVVYMRGNLFPRVRKSFT